MRFDFRGLDWDGKLARREFWLKDIVHIPHTGKIYIRSHIGKKENAYPFLKNYHNCGIKEFIHECIKSQGHVVEKYVNGQYQPHNLYGSFKDFKITPHSVVDFFAKCAENGADGNNYIYKDHSQQVDFNGRIVQLDWNNCYIAHLAERISIRSTFMQKVEYQSVEL
jgi:hypothetical protein